MRHLNQLYQLAWRSLLILSISLSSGLAHANDNGTEKRLENLKSHITDLHQWLTSARSKQSEIHAELRTSEQKIGNIAAQLKTIAQNIQATEANIAKLKAQRSALQAASKQQAQQLAQQIKAAHSSGRSEYLKVLLNQEQPADLARTLRYFDYFHQSRIRQIEQYSDTIKQLEKNEQQITRQLTSLQDAHHEMAQQGLALKQHKQQRHAVLLRLKGDISSRGKELNKLLADRQRLEELLASVEKSIAELDRPDATTPINTLKGQLPWPTQGEIIRSFGARDPDAGTPWNGVLIRATEGRDVHAIHYGRVVFADWLRGFGLLLILDHGNGYMSLYGYNQSLYKNTGDWVTSNEVISSVGNSGGQPNAGLYFEIRRNGKPQNPQGWIAARK